MIIRSRSESWEFGVVFSSEWFQGWKAVSLIWGNTAFCIDLLWKAGPFSPEWNAGCQHPDPVGVWSVGCGFWIPDLEVNLVGGETKYADFSELSSTGNKAHFQKGSFVYTFFLTKNFQLAMFRITLWETPRSHFGGCQKVRREAMFDFPFWIFLNTYVRPEWGKWALDLAALGSVERVREKQRGFARPGPNLLLWLLSWRHSPPPLL